MKRYVLSLIAVLLVCMAMPVAASSPAKLAKEMQRGEWKLVHIQWQFDSGYGLYVNLYPFGYRTPVQDLALLMTFERVNSHRRDRVTIFVVKRQESFQTWNNYAKLIPGDVIRFYSRRGSRSASVASYLTPRVIRFEPLRRY